MAGVHGRGMNKIVQHKALRRQMRERQYKNRVEQLAGLVRGAFQAGATASLWGLEGPLRTRIRADLCRKSWNWRDADSATRALLEDVFTRAGAERPDWYEGQPEWTVEAGTLIERTRCARCHKPLPEGHYKFCSRLCNISHARDMSVIRHASEDQAIQLAVKMG